MTNAYREYSREMNENYESGKAPLLVKVWSNEPEKALMQKVFIGVST